MNAQQPQKATKQYTGVCLAQDCRQNFLFYQQFDLSTHKHSKTQIFSLKDIKQKLKQAWQPKDSVMDAYIKKTRLFYENLRKQINKLIDEDQRTVQNILGKLKYHHLPVEANSAAYMDLMRSEYDRLDKNTIATLINQAENGQQNKDMQRQKQITNFLDLQLKKINDKLLTLKYVLLSKKLQAQMLIPKMSQPSKVADHDQFIKIYSLFNSRKMLIRSVNLVYNAKDNDFSPQSFYNKCIGVHNCMAIVKGKNGKVYGGFSPAPLVYHDKDEVKQNVYQKDHTKRSFIFSINNLKSFSLKDSQRALIYKSQSEGPCFGDDLQLGKVIKSSIGNSYESPEEAKVYLLQAEKLEVENFEVWQISF